MDNDDEYAVIAASFPESIVEPTVPLTGYSELARRLDNVFDAVSAVNETLVAVHSDRKSGLHQPVRAPRPETASQRLKTRQRLDRIDNIVQHMTGGR